MGKVIPTPVGVLSYPALWEPKADPNGRLKYSATLIFKSEAELADLKAAADEVVKAKWPGGKLPRNFKWPWRSTEEYADKAGYEDPDGFFIQFSRNAEYGAPPVVGGGNQPITDHGVIYPGCLVRAGVKAYAWEHKPTGKSGVSFSLEALKLIGGGEPIAGYGPVDPDTIFDTDEQATLDAALS